MVNLRDTCFIAAVSKNDVIGKNGELPWNMPSDLQFFKEMTQNSTIIMGRKTWQSLKGKRLPNRKVIVLSSNAFYNHSRDKDCFFVKTLLEAISLADKLSINSKIFIAGGETVYLQAMDLNLVSTAYITRINCTINDGDAFLPHKFYSYFNLLNKKPLEVKDCDDHTAYIEYWKEIHHAI